MAPAVDLTICATPPLPLPAWLLAGHFVRQRDRADRDGEVEHRLALEVRRLGGRGRRVRARVVDHPRGQVRAPLARAAAAVVAFLIPHSPVFPGQFSGAWDTQPPRPVGQPARYDNAVSLSCRPYSRVKGCWPRGEQCEDAR